MLLYGAGIDIYTESVDELKEKNYAYIPSLTVRADTKNKVLAGTKFYGILRIDDTAYVIYYADDEFDAIFPDYEEQTFSNLISRIPFLFLRADMFPLQE